MGREIRRVPKDWQHPTEHGRLKPLFYGAGGRYEKQAREWLAEAVEWSSGARPAYAGEDAPEFYWDYEGGPREAESYMLVGVSDEACTHLMLYESTSEGTPLSPAFETVEAVAEWAAEHATTFADFKATKEAWLAMLGRGLVGAELESADGTRVFLA